MTRSQPNSTARTDLMVDQKRGGEGRGKSVSRSVYVGLYIILELSISFERSRSSRKFVKNYIPKIYVIKNKPQKNFFIYEKGNYILNLYRYIQSVSRFLYHWEVVPDLNIKKNFPINICLNIFSFPSVCLFSKNKI